MRFGAHEEFAIDCVHEPIPNESRRVFGRMCMWIRGKRLGDFDEPACMLNVTAGHLQQVLHALPRLIEPKFEALTDGQLYNFIDRALYLDDDRTNAQVAADAENYSRFDFLTNGGESFDRFKSFIAVAPGAIRVLFTEESGAVFGARVDAVRFVDVVNQFLRWVEVESENAG